MGPGRPGRPHRRSKRLWATKAREVAVVGDCAFEALLVWWECLGEGREFVFCSVGKGDKIGPDNRLPARMFIAW